MNSQNVKHYGADAKIVYACEKKNIFSISKNFYNQLYLICSLFCNLIVISAYISLIKRGNKTTV